MKSQIVITINATAPRTIIATNAFSPELRPPPPVGFDGEVGIPVGDQVWVAPLEEVRDRPVLNPVVAVTPVPVGEDKADVVEAAKLVVKSQVVGASAPFEYTENTLPLKPS